MARPKCRVGVRRRHDAKHFQNARQQLARAPERGDRILERRNAGLPPGCSDLEEVTTHPFLDCRLIVAVANRVERRRPERQRKRREERVTAARDF
jgi:hypothetical protein